MCVTLSHSTKENIYSNTAMFLFVRYHSTCTFVKYFFNLFETHMLLSMIEVENLFVFLFWKKCNNRKNWIVFNSVTVQCNIIYSVQLIFCFIYCFLRVTKGIVPFYSWSLVIPGRRHPYSPIGLNEIPN